MTTPAALRRLSPIVLSLRARRIALGWPMKTVARRLGISPQGLLKWEHGERIPDVLQVELWSAVLGMGVAVTGPVDEPAQEPDIDHVKVDRALAGGMPWGALTADERLACWRTGRQTLSRSGAARLFGVGGTTAVMLDAAIGLPCGAGAEAA